MPEGAGDHSQARQPNENTEHDRVSCSKQSLPRSGAPHRQDREKKSEDQKSRTKRAKGEARPQCYELGGHTKTKPALTISSLRPRVGCSPRRQKM
jgi:hypothetical protein